jgi:NTP pyrophosphatase (non-canonical NTP hydrolase)
MSDDHGDWTTIRGPMPHDDSVVEAWCGEGGDVEIQWRDGEARDNVSLTSGEADALATWLATRGEGPRLDRWTDRADANAERWGEQAIVTLILAMAEELGELAEVARASIGPVDDYDDEVHADALARLRDVMGAGRACQAFLEAEFEDRSGRPLKPARRPDLTTGVDLPDARRELDDLGALCIQLGRRLREDSDE